MSRAKAPLLAGLTALTVLFSGCAGKHAGLNAGGKVATVDGTVISQADYDKTFNEFKQAFGLDNMPEQQKEMLSETIKQMALNKLILHTMIDNEAKKAGITVTDADVKTYKEEKILKDPAMKAQLQNFLTQNKMSDADFDAMIKENLLLNKFMDVKGGKQVAVTDAETKTFYDKNTDQFKLPERIRASHILVKAIVPEMKQEMREKNAKISDTELEKEISTQKAALKIKADKLFADVKAKPAEFETIAKKNSDDTMSAKQGGDLGYMAQSSIDPVFWEALEKTPNGKMYPGVLPTQFGYHIIKVIDHKPAKQETYVEAKDMIHDQLSQQKKQEFLKQWAEIKKAQAKIVIEPAYQPKAAAPAEGGMMPVGEAPPQQPAKH